MVPGNVGWATSGPVFLGTNYKVNHQCPFSVPPLKKIYHSIDVAGRLNPIWRYMAQSIKEQKVGARMTLNGMIKSEGLYQHY